MTRQQTLLDVPGCADVFKGCLGMILLVALFIGGAIYLVANSNLDSFQTTEEVEE
jgi:hypothetical protein